MKSILPLILSVVTASTFAAPPPPPTPNVPERPAIISAASTASSGEVYVYDQKPSGSQPVLIAPDQAQSIVEKFKTAYGKLNRPRMLIYVNRELVDEKSGMKLIARTEKTDTTRKTVDSNIESTRTSPSVSINAGGNVNVNGDADLTGKGKGTSTTEHAQNENRYRSDERTHTLADRQTVRDVERLFGRPLRAAGATLSDQSIAAQLIGNKPLEQFVANTEGEQARKDREALNKIADVAVEILISSRNLTVAEVSGDKTYTVPDIQVTAIRLSDAKIIGQASATDIIGKDRSAGHVARNFDVRDIAEATALALMDDIATNEK